MALGARVKVRRQELGMTQQELADLSGTSQASIHALEKRDSESSKSDEQLASALGVCLAWLRHSKLPMSPKDLEYGERESALTVGVTVLPGGYLKHFPGAMVTYCASHAEAVVAFMIPTRLSGGQLPPGAWVLADRSQQTPSGDDQYLVRHEGLLKIRAPLLQGKKALLPSDLCVADDPVEKRVVEVIGKIVVVVMP